MAKPLQHDADFVTKHSLAFILSDSGIELQSPPLYHPRQCGSTDREAHSVHLSPVVPPAPGLARLRLSVGRQPQQPTKADILQKRTLNRQCSRSQEEKRLARQCTVAGCNSYIIDRGLCFRHGGGRTCSREGCDRSAKARGLCWRHGGSTRCSVASCTRGAKSRGLCWAHGGGRRCSVLQCDGLVTNRRGDVCEHHKNEKQVHKSSAVSPSNFSHGSKNA